MVQLFQFPDRARAHRISRKDRVKFPARLVEVVRRILDRPRYEACHLERIPDGRMAVDHAGNIFVIFPSDELALEFTDELRKQGPGMSHEPEA